MSTFGVYIKKIIEILPHPNADKIEIAVIDGYNSIVRKDEFKVGELIAYIPENAVLPLEILRELGFYNEERGKGTLHGAEGNRVKAIKLRGILSQGICYKQPSSFYAESEDIAEFMGIVKYELPAHGMPGRGYCPPENVFQVPLEYTISFDIENWKSYPWVIEEGEEVVFTEKLHGTFTGVTVLPLKDAEGIFERQWLFGKNKNILIYSKGLGAKGLIFKNNEANKDNLYVQSTRSLVEAIETELDFVNLAYPYLFLGETFGPGVQDLAYQDYVDFRIFSTLIGYRSQYTWQSFQDLEEIAETLGVQTVPLLYRGPFSKEVMDLHTSGDTTLNAKHMREGIVIVPATERYDRRVGRVCFKSVSEAYILRKNGTEYV